MSNNEWRSRPIDASYLLDSGLLFEINRSILHLVGLALTVDKAGKIGMKDGRVAPETLAFTPAILKSGKAKLQKFMDSFGYSQLQKRRAKLGSACQEINHL